MRWKPSARSRSLRDISALSAPPARIGVPQATALTTFAATPPHGSFLPVRPVARGATHASPFQSARGDSLCGRLPNVQRRTSLCNQIFPGVLTSVASQGSGELALPELAGEARGRLSGLYSRECCAVLLPEREYPSQRPPAARRLSTLTNECGAVEETTFFQASTARNQRYTHSLYVPSANERSRCAKDRMTRWGQEPATGRGCRLDCVFVGYHLLTSITADLHFHSGWLGLKYSPVADTDVTRSLVGGRSPYLPLHITPESR